MANMTHQTPAALILAAGESRRFWPLSATAHKSLFRLAGVSLLERTIASLSKAGITEIVIVQSPRSRYSQATEVMLPSDSLPEEYGDCRLSFVEQPESAGQGDAILRSAHMLGDSFFVVQPENINAGDIAVELMQAAAAGDVAVVAGQARADFSLYAVLEHRGKRLSGIREKPRSAGGPKPLCSMGVYLFDRSFTGYLGEFEPDPISIVLAIDQLAKAGKASVAHSEHEFLPLKYPGHLWAYARFLDLVPRPGCDVGGAQDPDGVYADTRLDCIVSEGCTLGDDIALHNVILAPGVVIGSGAEIGASEGWDDLDAVVIGQGATIGANARIAPRVRIGVGATIGSGLQIDTDVADLAILELAGVRA
jgi:NDP-sugar pyrophosphorylase family protein